MTGDKDDVSALATIAQFIGITQDKKWYTGAGFGLADIESHTNL